MVLLGHRNIQRGHLKPSLLRLLGKLLLSDPTRLAQVSLLLQLSLEVSLPRSNNSYYVTILSFNPHHPQSSKNFPVTVFLNLRTIDILKQRLLSCEGLFYLW